MLIKIVLLALVTYWVSSSFGWPFWTTAVGGGVLYGLYKLARHFGWLGLSPSTPSTSGGGITAGMKWFLIFFTTLTGVMMIGTSVIGVSNNYAFTTFLALGSRFWLYPSGIPTDLLIWVALFVLSVGISVLTANGKWKPAGIIFGATLAFLFIARELPRVAEFARPKATTPMAVAPIPAPTTKWEEADQATSEGRGIAPVIADTAKKAVVGDKVAKRMGTEIRETVSDFFGSLFPPSSTPPAGSPGTSAPATAAPARMVDARVLRHECFTPCVYALDFKFELETQAEAISLKFPGLTKPVEYSGKGTITVPDSRGTGDVEITSQDPSTKAWVRIMEVVRVSVN